MLLLLLPLMLRSYVYQISVLTQGVMHPPFLTHCGSSMISPPPGRNH